MPETNPDEIIDVKLPRSEYDTLRELLKREEAYNYFTSKVKSFWVWTVAGGVLTVWALWDQFVAVKG